MPRGHTAQLEQPAAGLQPVRIDRTNAFLLLVDFQKYRDVDESVPDLTGKREGVDRKQEAVPVARYLVAQARSAGVRVIYTQSVRNGLEPEFSVFGRDPILQIGTLQSEIVDELRPESADIVIRKFCADPWHETDFDRVLRGIFPDPTRCTAVVAGGAITACAYFAIMGLYVRGFRVMVVTDAIYEYSIAQALRHFSRTSYPTFPNIGLSRSDLVAFEEGSATRNG